LSNASQLNFYNLGSPGVTNREVFSCGWSSNVYTCATQKNGTGSDRDFKVTTTGGVNLDSGTGISFGQGGATRMTLNSGYLFSAFSNGGWFRHASSGSATQPIFGPNTGDFNTGVGGASGQISLIQNSIEIARVSSTGMAMQSGVFTLKGFTVATLPAGPATGSLAYVTDANAACTYNSAPTGGGSTVCKVWYNGAAWVQG